MESNAFIGSIKGQAQKDMQRGILPSLTIAQAIQESGWGKSASGNNMFGIKANGSWTGATQMLPTKEFINGKWVSIQDKFRAYNSLSESLADHTSFLLNNSRYSNIIYEPNYKTACQNIQKDGYATDPNYSSQLIRLIQNYKLYMCDLCIETQGLIKIGEQSYRVKVLQTMLTNYGIGCTPDGIFGKYTQACVKAFQLRNNIDSDGIVGLITMSKF